MKKTDLWRVKGHEKMEPGDQKELVDLDHPTDMYRDTCPGELPICHGAVVKPYDRFSDKWNNGENFHCGKCGSHWCKCK